MSFIPFRASTNQELVSSLLLFIKFLRTQFDCFTEETERILEAWDAIHASHDPLVDLHLEFKFENPENLLQQVKEYRENALKTPVILIPESHPPSYYTEPDYVKRCRLFLGSEAEYSTHSDDAVLTAAHWQHNENLLKGRLFPGCHNHGVQCSCPHLKCVWIFDQNRCSCGNFKDFIWCTYGVDWLKDIHLDSRKFVGFQDKA